MPRLEVLNFFLIILAANVLNIVFIQRVIFVNILETCSMHFLRRFGRATFEIEAMNAEVLLTASSEFVCQKNLGS